MNLIKSMNGLGEAFKLAWHNSGGTLESFRDVALGVLQLPQFAEFLADFSLSNLAGSIAGCTLLPKQLDVLGKFGDPPITLFRDPDERFVIDLYLWLKPNTAIHDHGFAGACAIVSGQSLNVIYDFSPNYIHGEEAMTGRLTAREATLLRRGDKFVIPGGRAFIHKAIHLTCPTVSLVIRSIGPNSYRQYG